jgi:hypothetical protein
LPERVRYRLERQGFEPAEGELATYVSGNRVVAGIFTLGVSFIFKRPRTLEDEYLIVLSPIAENTPQTKPGPGDRLEKLRHLRDRGLISEEEYQERRRDVLRGL